MSTEKTKPLDQPVGDGGDADDGAEQIGIDSIGKPRIFTPDFLAKIERQAAEVFAHHEKDFIGRNPKKIRTILKLFACLQINNFVKDETNPLNTEINNLFDAVSSAVQFLAYLSPYLMPTTASARDGSEYDAEITRQFIFEMSKNFAGLIGGTVEFNQTTKEIKIIPAAVEADQSDAETKGEN